MHNDQKIIKQIKEISTLIKQLIIVVLLTIACLIIFIIEAL